MGIRVEKGEAFIVGKGGIITLGEGCRGKEAEIGPEEPTSVGGLELLQIVA